MTNKIKAWTAFGPRLEPKEPMNPEEILENIVKVTNQSKGSVLAVISELDVQLESGLKAGRVVRLPNETVEKPLVRKMFMKFSHNRLKNCLNVAQNTKKQVLFSVSVPLFK